MIDQIQTILRKEDISASALAEKLGVQRSSISHILSERNKPSLDFIQKIIESFPHINTEWLLSGKGKYLKQSPETKSTIETPIALLKPAEEKTTTPKTENTPRTFSPENSLFSEIKKGTKKKTIKVITFYDDNTFDEYFPN